jgi:hypothetical protein
MVGSLAAALAWIGIEPSELEAAGRRKLTRSRQLCVRLSSRSVPCALAHLQLRPAISKNMSPLDGTLTTLWAYLRTPRCEVFSTIPLEFAGISEAYELAVRSKAAYSSIACFARAELHDWRLDDVSTTMMRRTHACMWNRTRWRCQGSGFISE